MLWSMGSQRVGHGRVTEQHHIFTITKGKLTISVLFPPLNNRY